MCILHSCQEPEWKQTRASAWNGQTEHKKIYLYFVRYKTGLLEQTVTTNHIIHNSSKFSPGNQQMCIA